MITSTASCRRCARFTAALRKAATESVAETMRTLSSPAESAGKDTPTISPMIARTTTISTSVMPRSYCRPPGLQARAQPATLRASRASVGQEADTTGLLLPTDDVGIDSFAAGLPIGAQADNIRLVVPVLSRIPVGVVHAPGIFRDVLRQVWAIPLKHVGRLDAQRQQTLFRGGERPGVELVCSERGHKIGDLAPCRSDLGLIGLLPQSRAHQRHKQADDRYDHQHFDQRDTGARAPAIPYYRLPHDYTATSLMLVIASSMLKINAPIKMPITRITIGSKIEVKRLMAARVSVS